MGEADVGVGGDRMAGAIERFREAIRAGDGVELQPERVVALAAVLARFALGLDQIAWGTWKKMAPASGQRRGGPLAEAMARSCAGDGAPAEAELDRLRLLVSAMLSSVSQVGHFTHRELGRLSPELVEDGVAGGGLGRDGACWRRYKEAAVSCDEDSLEASMLSSMSEYVEAMLAGGARSSTPGSGGGSA